MGCDENFFLGNVCGFFLGAATAWRRIWPRRPEVDMEVDKEVDEEVAKEVDEKVDE